MRISRLNIENLRCIEKAVLQPGPDINILLGGNGAGKTSVLEAIYLAMSGRLRRGETGSVLRSGSDALTVFLELEEGRNRHRLGVGRDRSGQRLRLDGEDTGIATIARRFPVLFADPSISQLVEEGPGNRRSYLDWGVFHVEQEFLGHWQRYRRLLRQRNAALKEGGDTRAWDQPLSDVAAELDSCRTRYLNRLQEPFQQYRERFFPGVDVGLRYRRGWPDGETLQQVLTERVTADRERGYTRSGPHRADLRLLFDDAAARHRLSRGEQKLLSMMLLLVQIRIHMQHELAAPVLLIDDLAAELGAERREQLVGEIAALGVQSFLTFLECAQLPEMPPNAGTAMFHVEQGRLTPTG